MSGIHEFCQIQMEENIIWKAIDTRDNKLLGRGRGIMNTAFMNNILTTYQNQNNSIVLELFDPACTERIGVFSFNNFKP